jgi:hypothetical protein
MLWCARDEVAGDRQEFGSYEGPVGERRTRMPGSAPYSLHYAAQSRIQAADLRKRWRFLRRSVVRWTRNGRCRDFLRNPLSSRIEKPLPIGIDVWRKCRHYVYLALR